MNKILHGDSLELLKDLDDNSVDSIVTDPPYGYSFMGKDWDKVLPSIDKVITFWLGADSREDLDKILKKKKIKQIEWIREETPPFI